MSNELVHGIDYLLDFYAFLQIQRDADINGIQRAIREARARFHPDANRAFPGPAEFLFKQVGLAEATLTDEEKKRGYDLLLVNWQGPISTDGNPVLADELSSFSVSYLYRRPSPEREKVVERMLSDFLGVDDASFAKLEREVKQKGDRTPASVRSAYVAALRQRSKLAAGREILRWKFAGGSGHYHRAAGIGYVDTVAGLIAVERVRILEAVRGQLLLADGSVQLLIEDASGSGTAPDTGDTNSEKALARQLAVAGQRFDEQAARILEVAREREELAIKRLGLLRIEYRPPQRKRHPRLVVQLQSKNEEGEPRFRVFGYKLIPPNDVIQDSELKDMLPRGQMDRPLEEATVRQLIKGGCNVLTVILESDLDTTQFLTAVLEHHFNPLIS